MNRLSMADRAIGIFDSGIGGLTVFKRIAERLPQENLLYLGDTARVPYGTKSPDTVLRYARSCAARLTDQGIKLLVIACNTASAYALSALDAELPIPVIGVIRPGAIEAVRCSRSGRIGVIGTQGTVHSGAYNRAIAAISPKAKVFCQACPLFVPLAEEGWVKGDIPYAVAQKYLTSLTRKNIDTLVLGCTHYPLLRRPIAQAVGSGVQLVDSAQETAKAVESALRESALFRCERGEPLRHFMVSDDPQRLVQTATRFLGYPMKSVEWVNI